MHRRASRFRSLSAAAEKREGQSVDTGSGRDNGRVMNEGKLPQIGFGEELIFKLRIDLYLEIAKYSHNPVGCLANRSTKCECIEKTGMTLKFVFSAETISNRYGCVAIPI